MQTHMNTVCTHRGSHTEVKVSGVTSNGVDNIAGLLWGPQICLNGNDSEQLNHPRTTHRPGDHNTPQLGQAGKTHMIMSAHCRVPSRFSGLQLTMGTYSILLCLHRGYRREYGIIRKGKKKRYPWPKGFYAFNMECAFDVSLSSTRFIYHVFSEHQTSTSVRSVLIYLLSFSSHTFFLAALSTCSLASVVIMSRPLDSLTHPHTHTCTTHSAGEKRTKPQRQICFCGYQETRRCQGWEVPAENIHS